MVMVTLMLKMMMMVTMFHVDVVGPVPHLLVQHLKSPRSLDPRRQPRRDGCQVSHDARVPAEVSHDASLMTDMSQDVRVVMAARLVKMHVYLQGQGGVEGMQDRGL